jgi:hypothetical protein
MQNKLINVVSVLAGGTNTCDGYKDFILRWSTLFFFFSFGVHLVLINFKKWRRQHHCKLFGTILLDQRQVNTRLLTL